MAQIFKLKTTIPAQKSVSEIIAMLAGARAKSVGQEFDQAGNIEAVRFVMPIAGEDRLYTLPARTGCVYVKLKEMQGPRSRTSDADLLKQAYMIAWRQLRAWVEAQLALVDTGMAKPQEVFFAYAYYNGKQTFFEKFEGQQLQLTAGGKR